MEEKIIELQRRLEDSHAKYMKLFQGLRDGSVTPEDGVAELK